MSDLIFVEKYETDMKNLKKKISAKNYNDLESFFINTNLDFKQRTGLTKIISNIFSDGEFSGHHANINKNNIVGGGSSPQVGYKSWE